MSNANAEYQVDGNRLLAIIREENPQAFELALRRAQIEFLSEQNAALRGHAPDDLADLSQ